MKKGKTALYDVKTTKVSLVDRGANLKRRFPITKSELKNMKTWEEILEAVLKTEVEQEKDFVSFLKKQESLSEKGANAVKAALRLLSSFKNEIPPGVFAQMNKLTGIEQPGEEKQEDEKDPKKKKQEDENEKDPQKPWEKDKAKKSLENVMKREDLSEEVRKQLDDQAAELKIAKEKIEKDGQRLEEMYDEKQLSDWETKISKEAAFYPGDSNANLAKEIFEIEKVNPELAKKHFERMKVTSDVVKKSEGLKNVGLSFGESVEKTAEEELQKIADGMVEKGLTPSDAFVKAMEQNPELYAKYLIENPKQTGQ